MSVHCDMAKGAEDKSCTVEMRNETGAIQHNCYRASGTDATCTLSGLTLGKYMVQAYDEEYRESPAVEHAYILTKELNKDSTNS